MSTYYLDLAAANNLGKAEWKLEYNFTTKYNLKAINPNTLYNLAKRMKVSQTSDATERLIYCQLLDFVETRLFRVSQSK